MNHGHAAEFIKSKGDSNMTRLLKLLLNRNLLSAAAFAGALAPQALIAADALCPLESSTFHGTYLIAGGGMRVGVGTIAAVGEISSDGKGNTKATYTASVSGTIHQGVTVTGTYTVNSDCTATLAESDGSHYDFVISPDGDKVSWIRTDTGFVTSGTEVRLGHLFD
jgi:hypothetical protein